MVGSRWKDWKTMPHRPAAEAGEAVLVHAVQALAAMVTEPESDRSRPAITISSVDLPDPEGPTMPTLSPTPTDSDRRFRIWTRAAPVAEAEIDVGELYLRFCHEARPIWEDHRQGRGDDMG